MRPVLLLALFLMRAAPAKAAFEDFDISPRTVGMGSAFTALARGPAGLAYNAAGLADLSYIETELSYARLFESPPGRVDLTGLSVAAALPTRWGQREGGFGLEWRSSDLSGLATDREAGLSYAQRGVWSGETARLDLGTRVRWLQRQASNGDTQSNPAVDLGSMLVFGRTQFGLSVLNINAPDMSVAGIVDQAPRILKAGVAEELRGITLDLDYTRRGASGVAPAGYSIGAGAERSWSVERVGSFAFRTGLNLGDAAKSASLGVGYRRFGAELSYAAGFPLTSGGRVSHAVGLAFRFGGADTQTEYESLLQREIQSRKELQRLIDYLGSVLDKMREDLTKSESEVEGLKAQLASKSTEADSAQEKIRQLQALQSRIRENLQAVEKERSDAQARARRPEPRVERTPAAPGPEDLLKRDWAEYKELSDKGAPSAALRERLSELLRKYEGQGVDLGEVHQELLRRLEAP